MHLHPFRVSGGATTRNWLQFWVLLLLVPACFALATMPVTVATVALALTFGLPLVTWLALHISTASDLRKGVPRGIRFAAGFSITILGLGGLFAFSAGLAGAALAAYVVTVGLTTRWGKAVSAALPRAAAHQTPTATTEESEETTVVITPDAVREMTDADLCLAWRRSFVALQQARAPQLRSLVVHARQLLLDEIEARHPEGLRAWLSSGAQAAGGPDRFIGRTDDGTGHPEAA